MKHTCKIKDSDVKQIAKELYVILTTGSKVFICGNGGSAADAMHFSGELVCTYLDHTRKPLPVICLNTNTSIITAWANDKSYDTIFSRQIEALGRADDIVIGLSTSGKSKNILNAFKAADKLEMNQILLTGKNKEWPCNWTIHFDETDTPRIQETTMYFLHQVCEEIDRLAKADAKKGGRNR